MNKMAYLIMPFYQICKNPTYLLLLPVSRIEELYKELNERYNVLIEFNSIDLTNPEKSDIFIQIEEKSNDN